MASYLLPDFETLSAFVVPVIAVTVICDDAVFSDVPTVVRKAAAREAIRQDSTWTSENIRKHPALFVKDQIRRCDELREKVDSHGITLLRKEKESKRKIEDAGSIIKRHTDFLGMAKSVYKDADKSGVWPQEINGYDIDKEEMLEKVAAALERIESAKKEIKVCTALISKIDIRKKALKEKKKELGTLRRQLVDQEEQIKIDSALVEINAIAGTLGVLKDMTLEIEGRPGRLSIDDIMTSDAMSEDKRKALDFLAE